VLRNIQEHAHGLVVRDIDAVACWPFGDCWSADETAVRVGAIAYAAVPPAESVDDDNRKPA
jgi:hypothetical protein